MLIAENIRQSMDMSVDPCEDFYSFACGGFISNTMIPKNTLGINSFSIIRELTFEQLREILSEGIYETDIEPFRMAKQFFEDCLDEGKAFIIYQGCSSLRMYWLDFSFSRNYFNPWIATDCK